MIVQLAELHRVHTQLAGHLHLGVGEVMTPSHVDPLLHLLVRLSFLRPPFASLPVYSFQEKVVLAILVITRRFLCHG